MDQIAAELDTPHGRSEDSHTWTANRGSTGVATVSDNGSDERNRRSFQQTFAVAYTSPESVISTPVPIWFAFS